MHPEVAEQSLQIVAGIDIHHQVRTDLSGLEDACCAKVYIHWHFAGVFGFAYSNTFLNASMIDPEFQKEISIGHKLISKRVSFKLANEKPTRSSPASQLDLPSGHKLNSLEQITRLVLLL